MILLGGRLYAMKGNYLKPFLEQFGILLEPCYQLLPLGYQAVWHVKNRQVTLKSLKVKMNGKLRNLSQLNALYKDFNPIIEQAEIHSSAITSIGSNSAGGQSFGTRVIQLFVTNSRITRIIREDREIFNYNVF